MSNPFLYSLLPQTLKFTKAKCEAGCSNIWLADKPLTANWREPVEIS